MSAIKRFFSRRWNHQPDDQQISETPPAPRMIGRFQMKETLGVGGYSKVKRGLDTETQNHVALKIMLADRETGVVSSSQLRQLVKELEAMQNIEHPNVIRLFEWDDSASYPNQDGTETPCVLIVLELATGGEFFDFLLYTKHFDEITSRTYFHQLMDGIHACHEAGIAHRDLKPENLLLDENYVLKIADFGFARSFRGEDGFDVDMITQLGTPGYLAPEVIRGSKYNQKADLFACGIILFMIYSGFPPFQYAVPNDWWWDKIERGNFELFWRAHERAREFPPRLKYLLENMFSSNPDERYDYEQIVSSEWYQNDILSQRELARSLKRRKKDVKRARAKDAKEKQQSLAARGGGRSTRRTFIGAGNETGSTEDGVSAIEAEAQQRDSKYHAVAEEHGPLEMFTIDLEEFRESANINGHFGFISTCDARETVTRIMAVVESMGGEVQVELDDSLVIITVGVTKELGMSKESRIENVLLGAKLYRYGVTCRVVFVRFQGTPVNWRNVVGQILAHEDILEIDDVDAGLAEDDEELHTDSESDDAKEN